MMSFEPERDGGDVEESRGMMGNGSMMALVEVVGVVEVVRGLNWLTRQGLIARAIGEEGRGTLQSDEVRGRGGLSIVVYWIVGCRGGGGE